MTASTPHSADASGADGDPPPGGPAPDAAGAVAGEDGGGPGSGTAGASAGSGAPEPAGAPEAGPPAPDGAGDTPGPGAAETGSEGPGADPDPAGGGTEGTGSEAQAELAAQRALRERIARRKAERGGPVESGAKLSGQAADLLAAVRAVEGGTSSGSDFFDDAPAAAAPRPAAEAPRPSVPRAAPAAPGRTPPEALEAVRALLARGGAPETLAGPVAETLGDGAAGLLAEDPWLVLSVPGVRPEQADAFARALLGPGCGPDDERRAAALVAWLLERAAAHGHTVQEVSAVRAGLAGLGVPDEDAAVAAAVEAGAALVLQDGTGADTAEEPEEAHPTAPEDRQEDRPPVPVLLGLDRYAMAEESLADGLARLVRTGPGDAWEGPDLVRAAAGSGLVVHTGGEAARAEPVALVAGARERGLRALVAVHSRSGCRRLGPRDGAVTVADLLSGAAGPGRDEDGALALDLLAVLDAPLLDVESAAALVEALPDGCRLVLSGDPHVLGAAGPGRVFADLLAAGVCPRVDSRVPDPGPLGELVSGIGIGELNQVDAPGKEIAIVPVREAAEAVHRTVQLVADSVPRAIGVPADRTQVLTVGHGGPAGTRALNTALKQHLNPGPGRFGGFDPGDRVALAEAPGRTVAATVVSASPEGLRLDGEGGAVTVPRDRVASVLRHGWAMTVHQAAGMRWPAVVVVLPGDAAAGLSRPWVYTAFGRAERHLSVVHGVDRALPGAVADVAAEPRRTRLGVLLRGLLAAPSPS
ncbi:ATP-dependent RecD-like DNA helicase [Streptomyces sp. C10-9-1]|nr:ATP-dependent RecD-like DNA helicase [Streptomyces sp. C10-9-1]MCQ6554168.1 ATP-dependent RecD-like DNA helicase [Streptomyces sp. C10-9-1]